MIRNGIVLKQVKWHVGKSKAQSRVNKSRKFSVDENMKRGREWHEMDLRVGMGQIDHGLDDHGKDFNFILVKWEVMGGFYTVESCVSFEFLKRALWLLCIVDWRKKVRTSRVWTQRVYIQ